MPSLLSANCGKGLVLDPILLPSVRSNWSKQDDYFKLIFYKLLFFFLVGGDFFAKKLCLKKISSAPGTVWMRPRAKKLTIISTLLPCNKPCMAWLAHRTFPKCQQPEPRHMWKVHAAAHDLIFLWFVYYAHSTSNFEPGRHYQKVL